MRKALFIALALAALASKPFEEFVVISGTVTDCFIPGRDPEVGIRGLDIRAFDPGVDTALVAALRSLDTLMLTMGRDSASTARWDATYWQLEDLWNNAIPLARDTTSATGTFALSVAPRDSVLVLSLSEVDGQPSYYHYKIVGALSNVSMVLDMSMGACGASPEPPARGSVPP